MMKPHTGLELDHDVAYHRRFWKVQRGVWICWGLVMVAGFFGLLGPGARSEKTVNDEKSGHSLTYEGFIHRQAPAELKIRFAAATDYNPEIRVAINRALIEGIETLGIDPQPMKQEASGDEYFYTFNRAEPQQPMTVIFRYETKKFGKIPVQIRHNDARLFAEQFSFP